MSACICSCPSPPTMQSAVSRQMLTTACLRRTLMPAHRLSLHDEAVKGERNDKTTYSEASGASLQSPYVLLHPISSSSHLTWLETRRKPSVLPSKTQFPPWCLFSTSSLCIAKEKPQLTSMTPTRSQFYHLPHAAMWRFGRIELIQDA